MTGGFAGRTAESYARYRRDLPDAAVQQLVDHFALDPSSHVVDLGAGTGQVVVPLAGRVGLVIALEPEPDMLRLLRARPDLAANVLSVLGSDRDLSLLHEAIADRRLDMLTVANALHFMDAGAVFADARALLRPGGGIAVVSHGVPMWLADTDWARAVNQFLQSWLGTSTGGMCGLDERTREERTQLLAAAGFVDITVLRHEYTATLSPQFVAGHLLSALSDEQVPAGRRDEFESGILDVLGPHAASHRLTERVPVITLAARTPS